MTSPGYRGRFAPTPSGPLHLGSLVMALASWLDARRQQGEWLVRIDDIDPPRETPGAADTILRQLEAFALYWDGPVHYQSQHHEAYRAAVQQLLLQGDAFYCRLSRKDLAALNNLHPGKHLAVSSSRDASVRLSIPAEPLCFDDRFQGRQCFRLDQQEGAFVIRRRDGLFAYQLACAVDDADMAVTDVIRGMDLLESTPRQMHVLNCLQQPAPRYGHLPVVLDKNGDKLSKSSGAAAIKPDQAPVALQRALAHLGIKVEIDSPEQMLLAAL
ncbi:MAG: tRNA glutamyl-Q(34) synthetase GluQRS [Alcanivoracaceae bacterium]|nr:tRNA glutamyl-Q(34) synthetase GluQRS [Alcanivoracaceae bacterium]